ncbi:MAG TPA: glycosyltransferase family 4 protein, partial [Chthoniobacteraceae bacterium]|nr:glycosyltransferase family 4 protein [Chthoniobacteraceae bacterium]
MRIVLVLDQFDWRKGGLESWTWQYARLLGKRGCEVHAVAFDFHPDAERETGIVAHRLERPRSRLKRAEALERHLRTMQADVIHDMGVGWYADVIQPHGGSILATREHNLMRIPRWRRFNLPLPGRQREIREVERRQHAQPGAVIVAVSNMVKRHFETLNRLPAEKVRVIYNGVDLGKFSPAHRAEFRETTRARLGLTNETLFFLLAHNLRLKNAATLIRAMGVLAAQNKPAHLVIAGNAKAGPYVRLAVRAGAASRVTFLGLVDPVQYYAAADVAVLPTWYDPCSLFTLEAWAAGLPVITTSCNGASELMTEGVQG